MICLGLGRYCGGERVDFEKLREFLKYAKLNSYANENVEYEVTDLNSKKNRNKKRKTLIYR